MFHSNLKLEKDSNLIKMNVIVIVFTNQTWQKRRTSVSSLGDVDIDVTIVVCMQATLTGRVMATMTAKLVPP